MTLKIILAGILTLVPIPNWSNPEKVLVFLHKGGANHPPTHNALLFFDQRELKRDPLTGPSLLGVLSERDCSATEDKVEFLQPLAIWDFENFEISFSSGGSSPLSHLKKVEPLICDGALDAVEDTVKLTSDPKSLCGSVFTTKAKWFRKHDLRWLLTFDEMTGESTKLLSTCTPYPRDACLRELAGIVTIEAGLLRTLSLSGEAKGKFLTWKVGNPPATGSHEPRTFAGQLVVEVEYPTGVPVNVLRKSLRADDAQLIRSLTVKEGIAEATLRIENTPLSELLVSNPCEDITLKNAIGHAHLSCLVTTNPHCLVKLESPEMGTGGVGSVGRPKCEPPKTSSALPNG